MKARHWAIFLVGLLIGSFSLHRHFDLWFSKPRQQQAALEMHSGMRALHFDTASCLAATQDSHWRERILSAASSCLESIAPPPWYIDFDVVYRKKKLLLTSLRYVEVFSPNADAIKTCLEEALRNEPAPDGIDRLFGGTHLSEKAHFIAKKIEEKNSPTIRSTAACAAFSDEPAQASLPNRESLLLQDPIRPLGQAYSRDVAQKLVRACETKIPISQRHSRHLARLLHAKTDKKSSFRLDRDQDTSPEMMPYLACLTNALEEATASFPASVRASPKFSAINSSGEEVELPSAETSPQDTEEKKIFVRQPTTKNSVEYFIFPIEE